MLNKFFKLIYQISSYPGRLIYKNISLFALVKRSKVAKKSRISPFVKFYDSEIEKYSYVGWNTVVTHTSIGKFCSIAGDCVIGGASHPVDWASTSPLFYSGPNIFDENFSDVTYSNTIRTNIKNDVWIASNVIIKQGITIENGAIIGMGSVLTKDVGPYEIWVGNPAKMIGKRFNNDTKIIREIHDSEWWQMNEKQIKEVAPYFNDIKEAIKKIKEVKDENSTY